MKELSQQFTTLRRSHPAWLLLASHTGPLILASLKVLLDAHPGGIEFEEAVEHLASTFADNSNDVEFELSDDHSLAARRELRHWLKRGLIVERNGQLLATDALQRAFHFLESLEIQTMTSTASRLATVQLAIENLEARLSRSQTGRAKSLKTRIEALMRELEAVQAGDFEVLDGLAAEEGIREVYQLAISLQADFRRVEDSYRDADRSLRQRIISEKQNRGEIVDELLGGHEALVQTAEVGQHGMNDGSQSQSAVDRATGELQDSLKIVLERTAEVLADRAVAPMRPVAGHGMSSEWPERVNMTLRQT